MEFYKQLQYIDQEALKTTIRCKTHTDVESALSRSNRDFNDFIALISQAGAGYLEPMARVARKLTLQHFGRTMSLYIPLYLSNYCTNSCVYCGFRMENRIPRRRLELAEIEHEMDLIAKQGFTQLLLLTGEAKDITPLDYMEAAIKAAKKRFPFVSIEIFPLSELDYRRLHRAGVDGITLYQETYQQDLYAKYHPAGPKRNFEGRLQAIENAARAGIRSVGIGSLLGLGNWRVEAALMLMHAHYLLKNYWTSFLSISFPRLREVPGGFKAPFPVSDAELVQLIMAFRLLLPEVELVISTREPATLRDNLLKLGITRISAGSHTEPGGYSLPDTSSAQFFIEDSRSPSEVEVRLIELGFDPVWLNWHEEFGKGD